MTRFILALALALLPSLNLSAQQNKRPNYKLLWRISGNGLTRPSYLFGTMHVQDKRAFNLNDSVIAKIIQCQAFALEVHPDSATQFLASVIIDQDKKNTIESQMTSQEFRYYDSLMKTKTGLSLKKFQTIKQARYFFEQRSIKKDNNTFLDAWLYNVAREKNKMMTGLESIRVQMNLIQNERSTELSDFKKFLNSDMESDRMTQTLFNYYYDGDVEAIYTLMKANTQEDHFKNLIIDRNVNMTNNIISEIHQHTLFVAVGAGHLGGEKGIVNLLKQKGYTVSPVTAPFSGTSSTYKSSGFVAKWITYTSEQGGYSVEMPQAPVPLQGSGLPVTFQTHLDIGNLTVYMATHIPMGTVVGSQETTKALEGMIKNISASGKITNVKKITMGGSEGRELEILADDNLFKVKITIYHSNAYMLMAGPLNEKSNSTEVNRFLSSFNLVKPANGFVESVVSKEGAFSVAMPGKVTKQVNTPIDPSSGKPVKINLFFSTDHLTGATYIVRYNDFPAGYVAGNDSIYTHGILQSVYQKMSGAELSVSSVNFQGYPSTHFTAYNADRRIAIEGVMTLRGQRFYMLMNTRPSDEKAKQDGKTFLDSFRFNPFENPSLKEISFPEGFTLKVPSTFESDSSITRSPDVTNTYNFVDRFSGTMFLIITETLSKYYQAEDTDTFFSSVKENVIAERDVVVVKDSTIINNLPSREYLFQSQNTNSIIRIRAALNGNMLISLWAYTPANEHDLSLADQIFSSLNVTPTSDWSILTDKSDLVLTGISAPDSSERAEARTALATHTFFKQNHLPKIYDALKKNYNDDEKWNSTRGSLFNVLHKTRDNNTQAFIEKIYPTLPDTTAMRDEALAVLSAMKTHKSVEKVLELITTDTSGHRFNSYLVINPLEDSLSLLDDVIPAFMNLLPKFEEKSSVYRIIKMALDSSAMTTERRNVVISGITGIAAKLAEGPDDEQLVGEKYSVILVLFSVPFTSQVETIVREFAAELDDNIKFLCMQLLLKNSAAVATPDINALASKPSMRISLYEELLQYGKHHLIDKKYTTHKMLAESEVFEYLYLEDEVPDKVDFLKEMNVITNGEKKKIFVFTYGYNNSDEVYTAVTGPYVMKSKEFKRGDLTSVLYEEYKNDKELNARISEYLSENKAKLVP